ncbi:hypothetical protein C2S52_023562 [Perilla frutescens var. hirtella]|nr:hypothetical protein C2S52_023562 [Perilla frutescens var. hirtella]
MEESSMLLKHFSHEHPLEHVESCFDGDRVCSACKLAIRPNSFFYQCKVCKFSLHKVCYSMPKKAMHPADPNHSLNLLTSFVAEETNECEACGRYIAGFYYNCTKCSLHFHMLCVAMPLSVKIPSSHPHILKLELKPLYDFKCDICDRPSYHGWHYHCRACEFDAHVSCAVKGTHSPQQKFSPQIYSLKGGDGVNESKSHQRELMELLSEGMQRVEVNNVKNLDHDDHHHHHDHDHHRPLDQSIQVSEAFTLPSCQFSDACFSLDITNTEACNHQIQTQKDWNVYDSKQNNEKLQLLKRQSFSFGMRDLKREAPSTGICTNVWDELGRANENRNTNATNDRTLSKDQAKETQNEATGLVYICESCNYCLHKACSKLPQKLYHGADRKHALALLASPAYEEGQFMCNACGASGSGFCYHCDECQLDLHPVCAFMYPSLLSKNHEHALNLCYEPPYENKVFSCDVCGKAGSNSWLYRCEPCEFDVHMKCAKATQEPVTAPIIQHNEQH